MAYQPPTSTKYGPPLDMADPSKPSPFARTRSGVGHTSGHAVGHTDGFNAAAASAFQGSRNRQAPVAETDWTSFGANKRLRQTQETAPRVSAPMIDTQRNSLSAFVQAVTGSLPPAPEEKWSQSAIRKPSVATKPEPAAEKSYEDLFPTLGKKTPSSGNLSKSESTESLSFADLMKKRVREEEEANRLRTLEEDRLARQREEEERQNRMMGIVRRIRLGNNARAFETPEEDDTPCENDLDADVYGFRQTHYAQQDYEEDAYDTHDEDVRSTTPPYA